MGYVICYNNDNYEVVKSLDEFKTKHPNVDPEYVFEENSDINREKARERDDFYIRCYQYGFKPEHYGIQFTLKHRGAEDVYELIGFEPTRRKYTCRIRNVKTGQTIISTPQYIWMNINRSNTQTTS